jgi:ATP-dependent helicase HrpB
MALPIDAVLPELLAALAVRSSAVLVAPPGAGKTTAVAPALLGADWCTGRILLLSPRRLAARAAAERMATLAGEPVGGLIGYATRMDSRSSPATRIMVLTEGIFLRQIQTDPELAGVSAVLFDEIHERRLDSDFGLALALDVQASLRPDLRIVAMSATLDGARVAALLDDAPIIASEGRSHELTLHNIGRGDGPIEQAMAAAIRRAVATEKGGILAFLPGVAEIERTADQLGQLPADVVLHRLHGSLDPAEQRTAIAPAAADRRKLVLATSIAETSLTLDGVRVVVDSGLARRPRYDRGAGMTRLVTERASQAAVTQRAGRAARQAPGAAWRLWEAGATAGLPRFDPPEILEADLSSLVLDLAIWGLADPTALRWLDPPPAAAIDEARARLRRLGALDADGRVTAHGRAIATLPLAPRLAHMLIIAAQHGSAPEAAAAAVLLSERGLGGIDGDLELRHRRWRSEKGRRAEAARGLAQRWQKLAEAEAGRPRADADRLSLGACVALAFPDRLSRPRGGGGEDWISVGGRGFRLDPASPLARSEWLAVAETAGVAAGARIVSAAAIEASEVQALFADEIVEERRVIFDRAANAVRATRRRRLGAITLGEGPDEAPDREAIAAALVEAVRRDGLAILPWAERSRRLQARAAFARRQDPALTEIDDATLAASIDAWLLPLLADCRRLDELSPDALHDALEAMLGWAGKRQVDALAPASFAAPAGSQHPIAYDDPVGPVVELRPQILFGLTSHPTVGRGVRLVLRLVSPAGRPIQTTTDLPGFWAGSWAAVAREMRGRYPRHPWPEDPAAAVATTGTKRASRPPD